MPLTHPLIASYLRRKNLNIESKRADGRVSIMVDNAYRVYLVPANEGRVVFEIPLLELATDDFQREKQINKVLETAFSVLRKHTCQCVIDQEGTTIWLQQSISRDTDDFEFDQALEDFLNMADFWLKFAANL